jgi:tetratricopeptide (TPR) repeat protein
VLLEEALAGFRAASNHSRVAEATNDFGFLAILAGDFDGACKYFEEARGLAEAIGDRWVYAVTTANLVEPALVEQDFGRAVELSLESRRLFGELGDKWAEQRCAFNVALASVFAGRADEAQQPLRQLLENANAIGYMETAVWSLALYASVACAHGAFTPAAVLLGAVERFCEKTGLVFQPLQNAARVEATKAVEAELSKPELASAWVQGRALELDEAVQYALSLD